MDLTEHRILNFAHVTADTHRQISQILTLVSRMKYYSFMSRTFLNQKSIYQRPITLT